MAKPEAMEPAMMHQLLTVGHKNEVEFYKLFKDVDSPIPIPKFYYGKEWKPMEGEDGIIIMEDLSDRAAVVNVSEGITVDQVKMCSTYIVSFDLRGISHCTAWNCPGVTIHTRKVTLNSYF